jgi:hypothetical protein
MAQFSRRTVLAATDTLPQRRTHAGIDRLLLDHGLENAVGGNSKEDRANNLARHLINNPDEPNEYGENLSDAVITAIINDLIEAHTNHDNDFKL